MFRVLRSVKARLLLVIVLVVLLLYTAERGIMDTEVEPPCLTPYCNKLTQQADSQPALAPRWDPNRHGTPLRPVPQAPSPVNHAPSLVNQAQSQAHQAQVHRAPSQVKKVLLHQAPSSVKHRAPSQVNKVLVHPASSSVKHRAVHKVLVHQAVPYPGNQGPSPANQAPSPANQAPSPANQAPSPANQGPFPAQQAPPISPLFRNLTCQEVADVEKFVFFVGYGRSGHSIVASIMDAHPNVIIAHEYYLFNKLANLYYNQHLLLKAGLFDELYHSSHDSALHGWRANRETVKGYNLNLKDTWQGQFERLRVIGDKTAGATAMLFHESPMLFKRILVRLKRITKVPHSALHVVRNPYDMVATVALFQASSQPGKTKVNASITDKFRNYDYMKLATDIVLTKAVAVRDMAEECGLDLLEVHLEDLIADPRGVIFTLCHFMGVSCDPAYVRTCQEKVFPTTSRSRDLVVWPFAARARIEDAIRRFSFFNRYSFEGS